MNRKWLSRCANLGFLVAGAVAIAGSGSLGGCSSKSSPASPETDAAGSSSGGSSDAGYGSSTELDGSSTIFSGSGPIDLPEDAAACPGTACNSLVITDAPVIQEGLVPGSPPAFTGGTLSDGTYYLTSLVIYGADAGSSVVSEVTEDAGLDDASGDDASSDASSGTSGDASTGASGDASTGASGDASTGASSDATMGDGAISDGATFIGTPNGSFVEEVFAISAGATIAQFGTASGDGCTLGTVHLSTSGNMLMMVPFCGNPFSPTQNTAMTWPYTATSTTITASVPVNGRTAVLTLTMQ